MTVGSGSRNTSWIDINSDREFFTSSPFLYFVLATFGVWVAGVSYLTGQLMGGLWPMTFVSALVVYVIALWELNTDQLYDLFRLSLVASGFAFLANLPVAAYYHPVGSEPGQIPTLFAYTGTVWTATLSAIAFATVGTGVGMAYWYFQDTAPEIHETDRGDYE